MCFSLIEILLQILYPSQLVRVTLWRFIWLRPFKVFLRKNGVQIVHSLLHNFLMFIHFHSNLRNSYKPPLQMIDLLLFHYRFRLLVLFTSSFQNQVRLWELFYFQLGFLLIFSVCVVDGNRNFLIFVELFDGSILMEVQRSSQIFTFTLQTLIFLNFGSYRFFGQDDFLNLGLHLDFFGLHDQSALPLRLHHYCLRLLVGNNRGLLAFMPKPVQDSFQSQYQLMNAACRH